MATIKRKTGKSASGKLAMAASIILSLNYLKDRCPYEEMQPFMALVVYLCRFSLMDCLDADQIEKFAVAPPTVLRNDYTGDSRKHFLCSLEYLLHQAELHKLAKIKPILSAAYVIGCTLDSTKIS